MRTRSRNAAILTALISLASTCGAQSGYRVGENTKTADAGPVRMASFSLVQGEAEWRPTSNQQWSAASVNLPLRQGAQIYAPSGSRAEVRFDDGSYVRLGGGAVATLTTLYSDDKGEFTEIKLSNGLATLHLRSKLSLYQVDTPAASVKAYGPSNLRVGDTEGLEVAVRSGEADVEGASGQAMVRAQQYLDLPTASSSYAVRALPNRDAWDRFNDSRDSVVLRSDPHVPSNIGLVSGDLDSYGTWREDPRYGAVWAPTVSDPSWCPYSHGHWVWVDPFGWTWCGDEPWGWAPYHYGTWIHESWGWSWCCGPAVQYWSPAVVDFSYYGGNVCWAPLAPGEIRYPAGLSIAFGSGNWAFSFSIGAAGCYYPVGGGYCVGRPWNNVVVNRVTNIYNETRIANIYNRTNRSAFVASGFVPRNARFGAGSFASASSFGRGAGVQRLDPHRVAMFQRGRTFNGARFSGQPLSGPLAVRPTAASFTAARRFAGRGPSSSVVSRPVFRSNVPRTIARQSGAIGRTIAPGQRLAATNASRPAAVARTGSVAQNRYNRFNSVAKVQRRSATAPGRPNRQVAAQTRSAGNSRTSAAVAHRPNQPEAQRRSGANARTPAAVAARSQNQAAAQQRVASARRSANTPERNRGGAAQRMAARPAPREQAPPINRVPQPMRAPTTYRHRDDALEQRAPAPSRPPQSQPRSSPRSSGGGGRPDNSRRGR